MFDPKGWRQFLDVGCDAVLVLDRHGCVVFSNTAALRLLGPDASSSLPELTSQLGPSLVNTVAQVMARGVPRIDAVPMALPQPVVMADGRPLRVALASIEGERWALRLTLEAPREDAMGSGAASGAAKREESSSLRKLLGPLRDFPFPAALQDRQFRLIEVNQAYLDLTGFSAQQLLGQDPLVLQPSAEREAGLALRERLSVAMGDGNAAPANVAASMQWMELRQIAC